MKAKGLNPDTVYWMDICHIYWVSKLSFLFEKTKLNEKEAGYGPLSKNNKGVYLGMYITYFKISNNWGCVPNKGRDIRFCYADRHMNIWS